MSKYFKKNNEKRCEESPPVTKKCKPTPRTCNNNNNTNNNSNIKKSFKDIVVEGYSKVHSKFQIKIFINNKVMIN